MEENVDNKSRECFLDFNMEDDTNVQDNYIERYQIPCHFYIGTRSNDLNLYKI